jgi:hypothetical protein
MMYLLFRAKENSDVDVYTVHEPPQPPSNRVDRAASFVFVRDGFSWGAALLSPVYLAAKGQWVAFAAYIAIVAAAGAVLYSVGLHETWLPFLLIGMNIYLGFEASTLERMWLTFRDWTELGTVTGRNLPECERRFIENWVSTQPVTTTVQTLETEPGLFATSLRRLIPRRA